jgi:hypothetical protein
MGYVLIAPRGGGPGDELEDEDKKEPRRRRRYRAPRAERGHVRCCWMEPPGPRIFSREGPCPLLLKPPGLRNCTEP